MQLETAAIPYMVTGSTVSSLQGNPRSTHDIDVVVGLRHSLVESLVGGFPSTRFYVDEESIRDAISRQEMFNVLDSEGGDKIDFWVLKSNEFDQSMFRRRVKEHWGGIEFYVSQPEDTILSKLRWAKMCGGSEKQIADCVGVYEVNLTNLDMEYLREWAGFLGVLDLLDRVKRDAQAG